MFFLSPFKGLSVGFVIVAFSSQALVDLNMLLNQTLKDLQFTQLNWRCVSFPLTNREKENTKQMCGRAHQHSLLS